MTSDPAERVARAICIEDHKVHSVHEWAPCPGDCEGCILGYLPIAKAAIKAIREPSEAMLATGVNATFGAGLDGPDGVGPREVQEIWQAMIDAALEQSPEARERE